MNYLTSPPELNSANIFAGPGSTPMIDAAEAWNGLAVELASAAATFGSITSGLVNGSWQGPSSLAMADAAAPYATLLSGAAAHADQTATQAMAMAAEFDAVQLATVHPAMVTANRSGLVSLVVSNFFGQNAPAIAATEAVYEEMWAIDVGAMSAYHSGASAVASALAPFTQQLPIPAGLAGAGGPASTAAAEFRPPTPAELEAALRAQWEHEAWLIEHGTGFDMSTFFADVAAVPTRIEQAMAPIEAAVEVAAEQVCGC